MEEIKNKAKLRAKRSSAGAYATELGNNERERY